MPLYISLANFYAKNKEPDKAEAALRKVVDLEPEKVGYKFNLASLLWDTGRKEEAE